jgi:hypothetical protein
MPIWTRTKSKHSTKKALDSVPAVHNISTWNTTGIATDDWAESSPDPPRILRQVSTRRVSPPLRDCKCSSRGTFEGFITLRESDVDELYADAKTHPQTRIKGFRSLCLVIFQKKSEKQSYFSVGSWHFNTACANLCKVKFTLRTGSLKAICPIHETARHCRGSLSPARRCATRDAAIFFFPDCEAAKPCYGLAASCWMTRHVIFPFVFESRKISISFHARKRETSMQGVRWFLRVHLPPPWHRHSLAERLRGKRTARSAVVPPSASTERGNVNARSAVVPP